jgi:large subunit ribosomal protein L2
MGKRIIQQARGKGGPAYRVNRKAYCHKIKFPMGEGEAEIIKLIHSTGHTAPLMMFKLKDEIGYLPAFNGATEGQKIMFGGKETKQGNILSIKNITPNTRIYNIERNPGDGGKMMRTAGCSALLSKECGENHFLLIMPNKKEIVLSGDCRAIIGVIAGSGRISKPVITAGKKYYLMRTRGKLWPRTSAVKMNAVDHPFGSGRGKRIKSKIAKRNAPAGKRVGHIRPRQTGKRK